MKKLLFTAAAVVLALGISQAASADTLYFTSCHVTGGCIAGPNGAYGEVIVTQNGTSVDVTALLYAGEFYLATGALQDQYFTFNNTDATPGAYSDSSSVYQLNTGSFGHAGSTFAYGIGPTGGCPQGNCPYTGSIAFTITNTTVANLTTANSAGEIFLADVGFTDATTGQVRTGTIDVSGGVRVPDGGSTMMLLGSAFVGIGVLRRKFARS